MLDGAAAKKHAIEVTGDHAIEEVAIAFPPGTTSAQAGSQVIGGAAGVAMGAAGAAAGVLGEGVAQAVGGGVVGGAGVGGLVANLRLDHSEPYASVVLALSPTTLYLLGRHKVALLP